MISIEEAKAILGKHHESLEEAISTAWTTWITKFQPLLPLTHPRVRRSIMNHLIAREITARFQGSGVKAIQTESGRFLLHIRPIICYFKKLDERFRTSNYRTDTAERFDNQLPLPGIPKGVRVTIGYMLNELETALAGIFIVGRRGQKAIWHYEISGAAGGEVLELFPKPAAPRVPGQRIRPRRGKRQEKKQNSDGE